MIKVEILKGVKEVIKVEIEIEENEDNIHIANSEMRIDGSSHAIAILIMKLNEFESEIYDEMAKQLNVPREFVCQKMASLIEDYRGGKNE